MKTSTLLITGIMALSLTACGATTGGVARSLANQAAASAISSQTSQPATTNTSQSVSAAIDADMDCAALTAEMSEADTLIAESNSIIYGNDAGDVAGQVAVAGASQAALHSGAASTLARVPFGGLFAKAALDTAANSKQRKIDQAQADLQNANLRKATLSGLYAGKSCGA